MIMLELHAFQSPFVQLTVELIGENVESGSCKESKVGETE